MARQPEGQPATDGASRPGIWVWKTGIGNGAPYNVACLCGSTLHLRLNLLTAWGKNKIVRALKEGIPPETAIPRKRVEISLESVLELRYSEGAGVLEIYHGAKAPAVVYGRGTSVDREMYEALRNRIAPGVAPTAGTLSPGNAIYTPAIGLFLTVFFGGVVIWASVDVRPDPRFPFRVVPLGTGPPGGGFNIKDWLRSTLISIGTSNIVAIVLVVAACFAGWLFYRLSNPHQAEVIVLARQGGGSA